MRIWKTAIVAAMMTLAASPHAHAGSLQVSPAGLEIKAPSAASALTLKNPGKTPINAQVRVFRWTQANGQDVLEPTTDFVASPPMIAIQPGKDFIVRLVRLSKQPVAAEESYRILIDEIPNVADRRNGTLQLAFRYSVPVFFAPQGGGAAQLAWSTAKRDGKTIITAVNSGSRRVRLADFKVKDAKGKQITIAQGLAGYVLARSSMSWVAPGTVQAAGGTPLLISAQGDQGAINAEARAEAAR